MVYLVVFVVLMLNKVEVGTVRGMSSLIKIPLLRIAPVMRDLYVVTLAFI